MIWIIMTILYILVAAALFGLVFFWLEKMDPDWWCGDGDDLTAIVSLCVFWLPALAVALAASPFVIAYVIVRARTKRED